MDILIGGGGSWESLPFTALIDGSNTIRASTLSELAHRLYAMGVDERTIRLASPDDGDHAMSLKEHAMFYAAWEIARAAAGTSDG